MAHILLTGATDGIGAATAERLAARGHTLWVHGRDADRLARCAARLRAVPGAGAVIPVRADLAHPCDVQAMAHTVLARDMPLDVLIHNAGVFRAPQTRTADGVDVRLAVNTLAPMQLTEALWPALAPAARVVAVASAAQAKVDVAALSHGGPMDDMAAYAQSKLALILWTRALAQRFAGSARCAIAVNPGSMLGSKMVKQGFGVAGRDLAIGAAALESAALDARFAKANGAYFDNDTGRIGNPHPDADDPALVQAVVGQLQAVQARRAVPMPDRAA